MPTSQGAVPFLDLSVSRWTLSDQAACVSLIASVLDTYGLTFEPEGADRDVVHVDECYEHGEFWVVKRATQVVGTAAFRPHTSCVVEIRKMYLSEQVRRRGLGRFLLHALEERALSRGFRIVRVETASQLIEACELYRTDGYTPVHDVETERCNMAMQKDLTARRKSDVQVLDSSGQLFAHVSLDTAEKCRLLCSAVAIIFENNAKIWAPVDANGHGVPTLCLTRLLRKGEAPSSAALEVLSDFLGAYRATPQDMHEYITFDSVDNSPRLYCHAFVASVGRDESPNFMQDFVHSGSWLTRATVEQEHSSAPELIALRRYEDNYLAGHKIF